MTYSDLIPTPTKLWRILSYIEQNHTTRSLPDELIADVADAHQQAAERLKTAPGDRVNDVIEILHETLNLKTPTGRILSTWQHMLSEYPEDILRASMRDALTHKFGKIVPSDICKYALPRLKARKHDLRRIYSVASQQALLGKPIKLERPHARRIEN